tara:strand:+ start:670 stop:798 length:129 start_codon:yes stop_codon:yes gene_type:complete
LYEIPAIPILLFPLAAAIPATAVPCHSEESPGLTSVSESQKS